MKQLAKIIFGYPPAVEEGHCVVLNAPGKEGIWVFSEGTGVGVREQLQRLLPCRAVVPRTAMVKRTMAD
jgi:hypothetical protein